MGSPTGFGRQRSAAEKHRERADFHAAQVRLIDQSGIPQVDSITGLPPAVALQQQRGARNTRSTVGSVSTLSNLVRMLYSRAGVYPDSRPMLYAEDFSPHIPQGACPECHGIGRVYDVSENSWCRIRHCPFGSGRLHPGPPRGAGKICVTF